MSPTSKTFRVSRWHLTPTQHKQSEPPPFNLTPKLCFVIGRTDRRRHRRCVKCETLNMIRLRWQERDVMTGFVNHTLKVLWKLSRWAETRQGLYAGRFYGRPS